MSLQKTIEQHAAEFARAIIAALRSASIDELTGISGKAVVRAANGAPPRATQPRGRLGRRSANDIARALDQIVALLEKNPEGLRAEAIKRQLGLDSRELPRPIAEGLATGRLVKSGQKRATVYSTGDGAAKATRSQRPARKRSAGKKRAKR